MYLQLAIVGRGEGNQTKTSSVGQSNLLALVLGLTFQHWPMEEQVTSVLEKVREPHPETDFGSWNMSL